MYTLGTSNGLKHLSKTENIPERNFGQKRSNLSVFRIYPLSRSQEKETQTLLKETLLCHKSVQCEIWSTNPTTCTHLQQGHMGEVAEAVCFEETIKDENTNTDSDEDKITIEDGKEREDAKSPTDPEENAETCISLSDAGSLEIKDIKESTGYSTVQNQNNAHILDATNDITSVIGQDKDKETFFKQSIPKDDTESSLDRQIANETF